MVIRRVSRWFGIIILVLTFGLFALFGLPRTVETLVSFGPILVTGILFTLAGFDTIVTRQLGWHRIFGLGFLVWSISHLMDALFLGAKGDGALSPVVFGIVGAIIFGFIGFDIARGGHHFDIDPDERV
jgi:hypothetical protein